MPRARLRWMARDRARGAAPVPPPLTRTCVRCGALPNQPCQRTSVGGSVPRGRVVDGGYIKFMKNVHEERKTA